MTVPWSVAKEFELHLYPPSLFLVGTKAFDFTVQALFGVNQSTWRSYLPFGLGSGKWSWYSIEYAIPDVQSELQHLETYSEFYDRACDGAVVDNGSSDNLSVPQCLYKFAFETNTTELSDVTRLRTFVLVLLLALILHEIKNRICRPYFSSVGRALAHKRLGAEWVQDNGEKIFKFGEYVFRLIFHTSLSIYGVYYFYDKPWWDVYNSNGGGGTLNLWKNHGKEPVEVGMIWYYLIQCAYNVEAMLYLCRHSFKVTFFDKKYLRKPWCIMSIERSKTRRGDFTEMFVHHCATNALIMLSSQLMFHRTGSMILVLHDVSDIPVDFSKLVNFMKITKTTAAFCLVTLIVTWFVTRLMILPGAALYSVIYECHVCAASKIESGSSLYSDTQWHMAYKAYQCLFVLLIGALIALHIYWLHVIMKIAYVAITKKEIHDYSEHKTGETDKMFSKKKQ